MANPTTYQPPHLRNNTNTTITTKSMSAFSPTKNGVFLIVTLIAMLVLSEMSAMGFSTQVCIMCLATFSSLLVVVHFLYREVYLVKGSSKNDEVVTTSKENSDKKFNHFKNNSDVVDENSTTTSSSNYDSYKRTFNGNSKTYLIPPPPISQEKKRSDTL